MIHKLLLKLSVAAIAVSFASQTVLADASKEEKRKGFFESLFGAPKKKKTRRSILPWWKEDAGMTVSMATDYYGDEDYSDPEPIPGKGMGNLTYVSPKLVSLSDPSFSKLYRSGCPEPGHSGRTLLAEAGNPRCQGSASAHS